MSPTARQVADGVMEMMEGLGLTWSGGWTRRDTGCIAMVSGVEIASLNGVVVASEEFDDEVVGRARDEVAATGLPYCLQVRPSCASDAAEFAARRSMTFEEYQVPLMVLDDPARLAPVAEIDSFVVRQLAPAEADLHSRVAAEGFGAPFELFQRLATPSMLSVEGVRCYVGELDGSAVTTGMGFCSGSHVSIFSVATSPDHRGHGYGAALTTAAVTDGFAADAEWAWLQSSPDGFSVYQRLGFRTVEEWSCWFSEGAASED